MHPILPCDAALIKILASYAFLRYPHIHTEMPICHYKGSGACQKVDATSQVFLLDFLQTIDPFSQPKPVFSVTPFL